MAKYLLIESRDTFESKDVSRYYDLAKGLKQDGNDVTLFLVQNGVLSAREASQTNGLADVAGAGVKVLADDFSLRERGIGNGRLVAGVTPAPLDTVIDAMADGSKMLWD